MMSHIDHAYDLQAQLAWMHGDDARLQQMLRAQRRVNVAWMVRGADRLQAAGDVAGAQQLLDLALAYEPTNHAARLIYGRMLARASSFEAALQQFEQAGSRRYGFVAYESGITRLLGTGDLARAVPDLVLAGGDPRLAMLIRPRVELAARYSLESGDVFCADLDDFEEIARAVDSSATSDLVRARRATCRP
jgi:tetratricopeptide (TPR) repeat protein